MKKLSLGSDPSDNFASDAAGAGEDVELDEAQEETDLGFDDDSLE